MPTLYQYRQMEAKKQATIAQQNHNHFQNSNSIVEFVQRNTESIAKVLNSDHSAEHKLEMVQYCNESTQEIVAKWKELIYQGPYTSDEICVLLTAESFNKTNQ
jgi:hypothetical protein